jgi:cytochrome c biogenesis protein CcmG/thiol:disulfide interchange protein DsbE
MHIAAIAVSLALLATGTVAAQEAKASRLQGDVDPATGRVSIRPKGLVDPGTGWSDADRSPAAVARGVAVLERSANAYRGAAAMTDRAEVRMALPDGEQKDVVEVVMGEGGRFRIATAGMVMGSDGTKVYFVPAQPDDRCMVREAGANAHESLRSMIGAFSLPVPDIAFRMPLPGASPVAAFTGCGVGASAEVTGARDAAGLVEVLLGWKGGSAVVRLDPATDLVRAIESSFAPEGLPDEVRIGMSVALDPKPGAEPAALVIDPGQRRAVATLAEMFADAPAPSPGAKVKVGSPAPVAALKGPDGTVVDLGSLKGSVVVLDFWASWCGPCRKGLPQLQAFADEMKGNDRVKVFAVNVWEQCKADEVPAKVKETWTALKLSLPVLLDADGALIGKYGFSGIPATVVIGTDGSIAASHMGLPADFARILRDEVAKALGTAK